MTTTTTTTDTGTTTTEGDTRGQVLAFPTTRKRAYPNPIVRRDELPPNAVSLSAERNSRTPPMDMETAIALAVCIGRDLKDEVAFLRYRLDWLTQQRSKAARISAKRGV